MSYIASIGYDSEHEDDVTKTVKKIYRANIPYFQPTATQTIVKVPDLAAAKADFSLLNHELLARDVHFTYVLLDLSEGDDLYVYLDKQGMADFKAFVNASF